MHTPLLTIGLIVFGIFLAGNFVDRIIAWASRGIVSVAVSIAFSFVFFHFVEPHAPDLLNGFEHITSPVVSPLVTTLMHR